MTTAIAPAHFDVVVIGGGPAGQKAAIQAAKAGRSVLVVEREPDVGGECVRRGTIPSKTLRESALSAARLRRGADVFDARIASGIELSRLMTRLDAVVDSHQHYMGEQLMRNGIELWRGRARFESPTRLSVEDVRGRARHVEAEYVVIATGSRPRLPPELAIDHEHILDSDSILSLTYLPDSLTVLGSGVIACEYASIFAMLGTKVTLIDRADRPLKFMDAELVERFVAELEHAGGRFLGERAIARVRHDGVSSVTTTLQSGETITSEKVLAALGRVACLDGLAVDRAGLAPSARGVLDVDLHCRTAVPHIYAVGDVIGPPALASAAMEQGRRAMCHALGLLPGAPPETLPVGIYTVPELSSVGLSVDDAKRKGIEFVEGRASFAQIARGQISGDTHGMLKLVADARGKKLLGVHIVGDGATELVHLGQMALVHGDDVDVFIENVFNFPTLAEAYRVAALDVVKRRPRG